MSSARVWRPAAGSSQDLYPRVLGDVNGDGRADIVGFGFAGIYTALGQADGTFAAPILALSGFGAGAAAGGWTSNDLYPRVLGDVNGDGRADIVGLAPPAYHRARTGQWQLRGAHSGAEWTGRGCWPVLQSNDLYPRVLGDVNGDGRADIVAFGAAGVSTALGRADGSFTAPVLTSPVSGAAMLAAAGPARTPFRGSPRT